MRKLILTGLAFGLGGIVAPATQAENMGTRSMATSMVGHAPGYRMRAPGVAVQRSAAWGRRVNGRWAAGWQAPGGWNAYNRPVPGYSLPGYWISPSFYLSDFGSYGLPSPASGYGWSRYYDDAVLTDRYGRVVDARYDYDWDRFGGYEDGYDAPPQPYYEGGYAGYEDPAYRDRRDNRTGSTIAGAVAGGVIGGVAGSAIAGRGNRTGGAILGAGVGAIAGAALGNAAGKRDKHLRDGTHMPYSYGSSRGGEPYRGEGYGDEGLSVGGRAVYDGQWVGTWHGRDGSTYSGTYDGRFNGDVRGQYEQAYAPPVQPMPYAPVPGIAYGSGYSTYGSSYYATSEYVAPTVVTTTVTTEETTYVKKAVARRPVVRKARPKPRVVCSCSCRC